MNLILNGTDPCWKVIYNDFCVKYPELAQKNIAVSVNSDFYIPNKKNILWLHESPALLFDIIEKIESNPDLVRSQFCKIYTCIESLFKYDFVSPIHPSTSSWIATPEFMPFKSRQVSMISSNKNFTKGHSFRHEIINNLPSCVDLYGRGFKPINNKIEGLKDYGFSIAIENDNSAGYFTEKLLDCFFTCTVPIYWGSPSVETIFNKSGIIRIDCVNDLKTICNLSKDDYNSRINAIIENYYIAMSQNRTPVESLFKIVNEN